MANIGQSNGFSGLNSATPNSTEFGQGGGTGNPFRPTGGGGSQFGQNVLAAQQIAQARDAANQINIPRFLKDILSETTQSFESAVDSDADRRRRRRLGKRALRSLSMAGTV